MTYAFHRSGHSKLGSRPSADKRTSRLVAAMERAFELDLSGSGEKVAIIPRANFDWVSAIRSGLRQKRKRPSTRKKLADD